MEKVVDLKSSFAGKRVWLSGHTGFKGSWLSEWLLELGAEVHGFSLDPPTQPALFEQLGLLKRIFHQSGDVRDAEAVRHSIECTRPDYIFHMAAQPLVRLSYEQPIYTFETNVMGTVHVLNALRALAHHGHPCVAIVITTDKCYENREWLYGYREDDPMGGFDPYSASKGAAEIAIHALRRSYFLSEDSSVKVASARAGNVIGGGDWALDRIVPDIVRSLLCDECIPVRNQAATRPWQHVLEPLSGYLQLAVALAHPSEFSVLHRLLSDSSASSAAFNFGPNLSSNRTVGELVQQFIRHWPGSWEDKYHPSSPHEAMHLNLATDKALHALGWCPRWDFDTTVAKTAEWYKSAVDFRAPDEFQRITLNQIHDYQASSAVNI